MIDMGLCQDFVSFLRHQYKFQKQNLQEGKGSIRQGESRRCRQVRKGGGNRESECECGNREGKC